MPRISAFYGIVIVLYYNDHAPPHFHALYSGDEIRVSIDGLEIMSGHLPRRARSMVLEWATEHQEELRLCWHRARDGQPLGRIEPLP